MIDLMAIVVFCRSVHSGCSLLMRNLSQETTAFSRSSTSINIALIHAAANFTKFMWLSLPRIGRISWNGAGGRGPLAPVIGIRLRRSESSSSARRAKPTRKPNTTIPPTPCTKPAPARSTARADPDQRHRHARRRRDRPRRLRHALLVRRHHRSGPVHRRRLGHPPRLSGSDTKHVGESATFHSVSHSTIPPSSPAEPPGTPSPAPRSTPSPAPRTGPTTKRSRPTTS